MTAIDDLNKGWTIKRFEKLFAEPQRNGIYKTKEFHGRGQKIINMGELFGYDFISDQEMKRVELTPKELEKFLVKDGDLLFARRSLVLEGSGKCSLVVRPSEDTTFESSIIRTRLNKNEAEPKFYYYLFRSPLGRALMSSIATQTAVSGITGSNLVQLRVPHPPLPIQRKIAGILSAYDDLIENNTRRIEILEEMARSIYREWFVTFRFPGHEQVQMVDSELGLIPEGWEVKKLGEVIRFKNGKSIKVEEEGDYLVYGSNGIIGRTNEARYQNAIIIGRVGAYCGSLIYSKSAFNASDNTIIAESASEKFSIELAFYVLEQMNLRHYAGGAAQPLLTQTFIKEIPAFVPDIKTNKNFQRIIASQINLKSNLTNKIQNLRQTRDLLLPRLISGEIDVENLDINTGEIAA